MNEYIDISDDEVSDDGLKIVIESPKRKLMRKSKSPPNINLVDKEIIESIEKELENNLEEKAAKSNLTTINVKNILRQVVTNEHVLALVRQTENPETAGELPFEPKLTRAKAKELFPSTSVSSLPWVEPITPSSEVQKLITDELAEDSSGDEYVPAEEESEDDSVNLNETEVRSVSPVLPVKETECVPEVQWTEDGIFKIPPAKTMEEKEKEANIALRTRSKLSLSSTPLEVIEEAFIPPDITTDMYDMDCDDDDWRDFLEKFTRPLDEITKATEDEDHDPEYNILADEDIEEVDTEELRADKAVKVSRKEFNDMLAELFEHANNFEKNQANLPKIDVNTEIQPQVNLLLDVTVLETDSTKNSINSDISVIEPSCEVTFDHLMRLDQKVLLEQQLRQHVQLLTQHFLLTYKHPELDKMACKYKENLLNYYHLSEHKENSMFNACNLENAIKLITDWELRFELNTDEIKATKEHTCRVIQESKDHHMAGTDYIVAFPPLVLETISNSDVFLYPCLLPRIPFKTACLFTGLNAFTRSEDELIALGLEQFIPFLSKDPYNLTKRGEVKLRHVCVMIVTYMMPTKDVDKVFNHIWNCKLKKDISNPIKFYFENKKAPVTIHYVVSLDEYKVVPPRKRSKELLPHLWRQYLYPETSEDNNTTNQNNTTVITKVTKPPSYNKNFSNRIRRKSSTNITSSPVSKKTKTYISSISKIESFKPYQRGLYCSTPKSSKFKKLETYFKSPKISSLNNNDSCIKCVKFNSTIFKNLKQKKTEPTTNRMLPSMPFLGLTLNSNDNVGEVSSSKEISTTETNDVVEADSTIVEVEDEEVIEKDNPRNITALMIASSTIKSLSRRGLTGPEKKKAKLCKEFNSTMALLLPEEPQLIQEKAQSYAQAYFDKVRERLEPHEYQQFMEILNNYNDKPNSVSELYKQMEMIIGPNNDDLMEEFLTFLTPAQAKDLGKLIPYYMLNNMSLFLRKLEIHFKEQPAQLRKIYRSLTDLCACMNVSMDKVKNTILPLLRGNSLLTDWFLQIFPCEPPPPSLLKGPWEHVEVRRECNVPEDVFEAVSLPEAEDSYASLHCGCSCHQGEHAIFKSFTQHCVSCGLKFLQGRVYVQTSKGLRLANVSFNSNSEVDHLTRLNCSSLDRRKRRSESSPSKQFSHLKDYQDEIRLANNDSEDDGDAARRKARIIKSPRKKRVKNADKIEKPVKEIPSANTETAVVTEPETVEKSITEVVDLPITNNANPIEPEDDSDKILAKPLTDDVTEWDCNTSMESIEVRHSPEHSGGSESEFCEESSQDNINTETDESPEEIESLSNSPVHSENSNSNPSEDVSWTRDEDKTILETLRKEGGKEEAFICISEMLKHRTVSQIKDRFRTLMNLLQKMTCED